jgi:uncharacterized protein (TIGR02996 family)
MGIVNLPEEFMAGICADKSDDIPRLIAADWLDEHGESDRAEFIRVQCEIAVWNGRRPMPEMGMTLDRFRELCEREEKLLRKYRGTWGFFLAGAVPGTIVELLDFHRGFINVARCDWHSWANMHGSIMKHPIERVELSDWPRVEENQRRNDALRCYEIVYRFEGYSFGSWTNIVADRHMASRSLVLSSSREYAAEALLKNNWPGITFQRVERRPTRYTATIIDDPFPPQMDEVIAANARRLLVDWQEATSKWAR